MQALVAKCFHLNDRGKALLKCTADLLMKLNATCTAMDNLTHIQKQGHIKMASSMWATKGNELFSENISGYQLNLNGTGDRYKGQA